jgi:hypothetical protein
MKTTKHNYWDAKQAKADGKPLTAVDIAIMLRSDLTHEELQFGENRNYVSFSSTLADGANGCRFKYIQYTHPKRWRTLVEDITDSEEQILWNQCCIAADLPNDWQTMPYDCSYSMSAIIGDDMTACTCSDITIYQGPKHLKYDKIGLLSFALEKSPSVWRNIQRWAMWGWTVIIRPDPHSVWCSESCCKMWNKICSLIGRFMNTEIDPQESYEIRKSWKGVGEIEP